MASVVLGLVAVWSGAAWWVAHYGHREPDPARTYDATPDHGGLPPRSRGGPPVIPFECSSDTSDRDSGQIQQRRQTERAWRRFLNPRRVLAVAGSLLACGPSVVVMEPGDGTSGGRGTSADSGEATAASTITDSSSTDVSEPGSASGRDTVSTSTDPVGVTSDDATASDTFMTSRGDSDTGAASSTSGDTGDDPNGAPCSLDQECASNACWMAGIFGGICGECNEDADCAERGEMIPRIGAFRPEISRVTSGSRFGLKRRGSMRANPDERSVFCWHTSCTKCRR